MTYCTSISSYFIYLKISTVQIVFCIDNVVCQYNTCVLYRSSSAYMERSCSVLSVHRRLMTKSCRGYFVFFDFYFGSVPSFQLTS